MNGSSVSAMTELLMNIFIGSFSAGAITWALVGVQVFIDNRRRDKRDAEYHHVRMKHIRK